MIKEIITKITKQNSSLCEFIDGLDFIKQVHSFYKIIGGIQNPSCSKGILKYVANEHEIGWMYVVKFLNLLMTNVDQKRFEAYKENIDWECVCQQYCPKEMKEANTKVAFKDLFYLVALNKNDDIESILAEHYLSAYGWYQIVKKVVALYEDMLCIDKQYVEQICPKEAPVMEVEEVPVVEKVPVKKKEHFAPSQKPQKYKRGRTIILEHPDGTISEWKDTQAIHEALGISKVAVRKNISGNSRYIRFNHQKYQAFYKEAC
jgi:hypothetical protein